MLKRSRTVRSIAIAVVLLFVCLLLVATITGIRTVDERQVLGRLSFDVAQLPTQAHDVDSFRIAWENDKGGRLVITHHSDPNFPLWATVPGRGFVGAGVGEEEVIERRGHFQIREHLRLACAEQSIEAIEAGDIEAGDHDLTLTGHLGCENGEVIPYALTFTAVEPHQLAFTLSTHAPDVNRSYLTYASQPDEHFYGFGAQFSEFDLKGKRLPIFVNEQGIGRGAQPLTLVANLQYGVGGSWYSTYAGVPHYISSELRSLFLENNEYAVFDLRAPSSVQIQIFAPTMRGRILHGDSPAELIAEYTLHTGRMRPLPPWVHQGAILSLQGGTERVKDILATVQASGAPIAGVWLQDWVGQRSTSFGEQLWWNWELDTDRYADWDQLLAELNDADIRVLTYINPFIADASDKPNHNRNLYEEAVTQGYLVLDKAGDPYMIENSDFSAGLVDFTSPAARDWMRDVIVAELIAAGADGWMADFGEGLPFDARLASGEPAAAYHNQYPQEWARLNREALEASEDPDDMFFFMRSGYRESPGQSTAFWLGDQLVSWDEHDGIKTAVTGLLSSGMSGFSLNHSDIGGYTSVAHPVLGRHRSDELLQRWMELNAFSTIFRTHESNRPDENVQVYDTPELLNHFDRFARVYRAWDFYREQLVHEAAETGMPVVRHMFVHYPDDPNVYDLSYQQFLVGDEFIVAPVLDPGRDEVTVYLPVGRWVHLWSGDRVGSDQAGATVTVPAPMGEPGVFYREGSAVADEFLENLREEGVVE